MSRISNDAFVAASQNGTLDSYEKWVDSLLRTHTNLTNHELVDILVRTYGPDSEYGHIFSGTLAMMDTAGKLRKVDRICKVTGSDGSGYYKNPDYTEAKQPEFEYERSVKQALPGAVKTFNRRADALGKDRVKIVNESTVKKLRDLEWALRFSNYGSQQDAAKDLDVILKEIL